MGVAPWQACQTSSPCRMADSRASRRPQAHHWATLHSTAHTTYSREWAGLSVSVDMQHETATLKWKTDK
jgi:hypothetical protein